MKELIDASIAIARRHRHGGVVPEHVIAAIAEHETWWRSRIAPVVRPELLRLVDEHMAAVATTGNYRESFVEPRLAPETEALFVPSKWLRREVNLPLVLKRLDARTTLFKDVMMGLHSIDAEVRAAVHVVRSRNHVSGVRLEHLLCVLCDREWFQRALPMVGGDRDRFVMAVEERLDALGRGAPGGHVAAEVVTLIAQCRLQVYSPTVDALLELALLERRVQQIFSAAGVSVPALQALLMDGLRN